MATEGESGRRCVSGRGRGGEIKRGSDLLHLSFQTISDAVIGIRQRISKTWWKAAAALTARAHLGISLPQNVSGVQRRGRLGDAKLRTHFDEASPS